jgi:hypothetical protein
VHHFAGIGVDNGAQEFVFIHLPYRYYGAAASGSVTAKEAYSSVPYVVYVYFILVLKLFLYLGVLHD